MKPTRTPEAVPISGLIVPIPGFNSAIDINRPSPDPEQRVMPYNQTADDGLASRRSKHEVRTYEELAAATSAPLAIGYGLSLRSPMAAQAENDQFPMSTDPYGKQRS